MPYNKSFIDQASSVKMAGYWPRSLFCIFMDLRLRPGAKRVHLVKRCYNTFKEVGVPNDMDNSHILSITEQKMCAEDRKQ